MGENDQSVTPAAIRQHLHLKYINKLKHHLHSYQEPKH